MTAAFTPGSYLARRRQAHGLTVGEVAAKITTDPHMAEHDRRAWLTLIEADAAPIAEVSIRSLRAVYRFDVEVLERLADLHWCQAKLPAPRLCRICACSENDPCLDRSGEGCAWAAEDLCTACVPVTASVCVATPSSQGVVV